ncbi:MAG: helicase C-terminal domain-containing protein [Halanaeroarchaeum sp.]
MKPGRIVDEFPAPSFRGAQEQALCDVREAFEDGNDVVLVRAPTGTGKSLIGRAIMGCARRPAEAEPTEAVGAYYTTPQVSQLDDVANDDLLEDLQIVRGKRNYHCVLDGEEDTPVDRAPCARIRGYDCAVKHRCPYFSARAIASSREYAGMTLAYFMHTAGSDVFGKRDVGVVDEAHGLGEWAEMYAAIELGPATLPVWDDLRIPDLDDDVDRTARFAEQVVDVCESAVAELRRKDELTPDEAGRRDRLEERIGELSWFVEDSRDPDGATTWVVDQAENGRTTIKPMDPERYLQHTIWDRANRFALLSATILDKDAFCRGVGLDPENVALVDVPHTFPLENRPLYDVTQGRMTYDDREETIPRIAETLVSLMTEHADEKGIVHAHSYDIQTTLAGHLRRLGVDERVRVHDRDNRDASLRAWLASDDPEVFIAVKMEEALDLEGDLARWQVLTKAPFPNTSDSRVASRLAEGQWAWYYRTALRTVIQAAGRVVRSPDDFGATYLADTSLLDLFERARTDMPPWFAAAVDRMERPDLPDIDAEGAVAGMDGGVTRAESVSRESTRQRVPQSDPAGTGESDRDEGSRSPLSDVWDP